MRSTNCDRRAANVQRIVISELMDRTKSVQLMETTENWWNRNLFKSGDENWNIEESILNLDMNYDPECDRWLCSPSFTFPVRTPRHNSWFGIQSLKGLNFKPIWIIDDGERNIGTNSKINWHFKNRCLDEKRFYAGGPLQTAFSWKRR